MTNVPATASAAALLPPPPSTPCVPPELQLALADRDPAFVHDGSPAWSVEHAVRLLDARGAMPQVASTLARLRTAAEPVPRRWLGDRLAVLWTMFMASRTQADADALTIWLAEHMRLLGDLPHDIVAAAIDRAVQTARHGFLPSIGEVRAHAEGAVADRAAMIERLSRIVRTALP